MDDTTYFTIQVKGEAYRFAPLPEDDVERVVMILEMSTTPQRVLKALTRVMAASAGAEGWDKLTDLYVTKQVELSEITTDLFETILKRMAEAKKPAKTTAKRAPARPRAARAK